MRKARGQDRSTALVRDPQGRRAIELIRRYECPNTTHIADDGSWPIVWKRAKGVFVWDTGGRRYLDLTAAFGVALAGHSNPRVVRAGQRQLARLVHAMGDVHPHALKAELARELSRITFERWSSTGLRRGAAQGKTIFCNSGFEAVEAALKTALLATGRPGVIAFKGGYHGLGYGALAVTDRRYFRHPFEAQIRRFASFAPFPTSEEALGETERVVRACFSQRAVGAVLVEPIQGRGGIKVPPVQFLPLLRKICDRWGAVLILDEIYTGFGRTGRWFACEEAGTVPDLICLGKGLTGGFPLSACVGEARAMDRAWPRSLGEALHTSTYLGHPVGCAMALAQLRELRERNLWKRGRSLGSRVMSALAEVPCPPGFQMELRGRGLMLGIECRKRDGKPATAFVLNILKQMLAKGFILLPEGEAGNVISLTPPLTISASQLDDAVMALREVILRSS